MHTKKYRVICIVMFFVLIVGVFFSNKSNFKSANFSYASGFNQLNETNQQAKDNFTNLIVFISFSNESNFVDNNVKDNLSVKQITENSYSLANYSVKDYYYRVSNGKVDINTVYLYSKNGEALKLNKTRGYYCVNDLENTEGYDEYDSSEKALRMNELQQDWAQAINNAIASGCQITDYDRSETYPYSILDKNGDGIIDSLTIIYNYSADYSVNYGDCLWNYQYYSNYVSLTAGNKTIISGNYVQLSANYTPLYYDTVNEMYFANLKPMIHEMGHIFGLKDLYTNTNNSPVYFMSAMANAFSTVPQYISAKEREALGWLDNCNISVIKEEGTFIIKATSSEIQTDIICYKIELSSINKTLYLEYRNFAGTVNKYDTQSKQAQNQFNKPISVPQTKSGLVCFLMDKDIRFPSNLYASSGNYNYTVFGRNSTDLDTKSALAVNESYAITSSLSVEVLSMSEDSIEFKITGNDFAMPHIHTKTHIEAVLATCKTVGNIEHYKCEECGKLFSDELLENEISQTAIIVDKLPHSPVKTNGYPATCKKTGLTDGEKCENCDEMIVSQTTIDKIPHSPSDWIIDRDSTETQKGQKHKSCLACGDILETAEIDLKPKDNVENDISGGTKPPSNSNNNETSKEFETNKNSNETKTIIFSSLIVFAISAGVVLAGLIIYKRKKIE